MITILSDSTATLYGDFLELIYKQYYIPPQPKFKPITINLDSTTRIVSEEIKENKAYGTYLYINGVNSKIQISSSFDGIKEFLSKVNTHGCYVDIQYFALYKYKIEEGYKDTFPEEFI